MRLILYKRIANTKHIPELVDLKEEIIDRFGMLPESVINLFDIAKLKQKASNLGIRKIDLGENGVGCFWSESRSFISGFDIFFQSIDVDGSIQLSQGGVSAAMSNGDDYIEDIVPTPDGNYLIFSIFSA